MLGRPEDRYLYRTDESAQGKNSIKKNRKNKINVYSVVVCTLGCYSLLLVCAISCFSWVDSSVASFSVTSLPASLSVSVVLHRGLVKKQTNTYIYYPMHAMT